MVGNPIWLQVGGECFSVSSSDEGRRLWMEGKKIKSLFVHWLKLRLTEDSAFILPQYLAWTQEGSQEQKQHLAGFISLNPACWTVSWLKTTGAC